MSFTELKGFDNYGQNLLDDQIRTNLISFFDWGLLQKNNFANVNIPTSGQYGGSKHKLELVKDPRYNYGQVYQGFRGNWVWQTGLNSQSILVSGVNVDGTFYPLSTTGPKSHYIDYPNGRIVFNSPISTTSVVTAEYSYKYVNVIDGNDSIWVKQIQSDSFRLDTGGFNNPTSGNWSANPENRLQLPLIAVEVTSAKSFSPYQIGLGGQTISSKIIFHVFAENDKTANHISNIIGFQNDKELYTFDVNQISKNNLSPLNYQGSPKSGAMTYPQMIGNYTDKIIYLNNMNPPEGQWLNGVYYIPISCRADMVWPRI